MRHSSLVPHVGSEMTRLGRIVFGEGPHFATMPLCSFSGKKPQRAMTRSRKLSVRLQVAKEMNDYCKSPVARQKMERKRRLEKKTVATYLPSPIRHAQRKGGDTCWMTALSMRRICTPRTLILFKAHQSLQLFFSHHHVGIQVAERLREGSNCA